MHCNSSLKTNLSIYWINNCIDTVPFIQVPIDPHNNTKTKMGKLHLSDTPLPGKLLQRKDSSQSIVTVHYNVYSCINGQSKCNWRRQGA